MEPHIMWLHKFQDLGIVVQLTSTDFRSAIKEHLQNSMVTSENSITIKPLKTFLCLQSL